MWCAFNLKNGNLLIGEHDYKKKKKNKFLKSYYHLYLCIVCSHVGFDYALQCIIYLNKH